MLKVSKLNKEIGNNDDIRVNDTMKTGTFEIVTFIEYYYSIERQIPLRRMARMARNCSSSSLYITPHLFLCHLRTYIRRKQPERGQLLKRVTTTMNFSHPSTQKLYNN